MLSKVISSSIEVIRVLHVDDDPNQYEFIKFFLNQIDPILKVHCVATPDEVFDELEKNNYDCLVTDFQMPEMNGIELSKKVRENDNIPIILYTGQGSEEVAEAAFTIGIDDYIRKEMDPSHYQVLAKRIRHVVEKKQAETLYENVVEQARDAMCILIDGKIVFANHSAIELFKHESLEDLIGTNPFFKNRGILNPGFHRLNIEKKNSEKQYLEISSSPMTYCGKEAILCFIWDTTEKRTLELEKKISQERFKALVELAPDGIATFNSLGYMTFLNKAFSTLTGFSHDELLGQHLTKLQTLRKRDILSYLRIFTTVIRGGISPSREFIFNRKDGTKGAGEGHIGLIDVNNQKEMLLIARDISERKMNELKLQRLFENTSDGIIEIDRDGIIMNTNNSTTKLLNIGKNQLIGNSLYEITQLDTDFLTRIEREVSIIKKNNKKRSFKHELVNEKSKNIQLNISIHPMITEAEFFGVQIIIEEPTKLDFSKTSEQYIENSIQIMDYEEQPLIDPKI